MNDIHDIPATLLDAEFSEEELVPDAASAFSPKPAVSREGNTEQQLANTEFSVVHTSVNMAPSTPSAGDDAKERAWRKPEDKPKRPLSAYNLFFQLERQRLISDPGEDSPYTAEDVANISHAHKMKKEKRRHRKTHGKISFADLARTIAQKWKSLEPSDKVVFDERAEIEKAHYKEDLEEWNIKQQQNFLQRKANMLRKVSLEPNPGMGNQYDQTSMMGMGSSGRMGSAYQGTLSQGTYDLGIYGDNHDSTFQEDSLQHSLMQRQSLARYQALMEHQLDQASLDQMMLGYGASSGTSAFGGLSAQRSYLSSAGAGSTGYGNSPFYYEDEYDYSDLAQAYSTGGSSLGRRSVTTPSRSSQFLRRISEGGRDTTPARSSAARSLSSDQRFGYSTMDQSTASVHSENTHHARPNESSYLRQTSLPDSSPAAVEDALTLDPHQGMSSPVLEADDGRQVDSFPSMHVI